MININSKSDALIILVHEIYGINQHMKEFCQSLSEKGFDIICPNLLNQEAPFEYSQEESAYHNFMDNIGLANASGKIKSLLSDCKDRYEKVFIVGFSIGATIAWLCSMEDGLNGIVGYYGSRIRSYVEINPLCPTMLFFPEMEQSFNVDDLISCLVEKNIKIHNFNGQHGFSDPFSQKYNEESAQEAFEKMYNFLKNH